MKKLLYTIILLLSLCPITKAQQTDSCGIQISLLTCTPGSELYSSFGHSALRVVDASRKMDIVFNYGTFDFDDPHFYNKFVRGQLLYFVSTDDLEDFLAEYKYFKRGVTEQVLNLSCAEKDKLVAALFENAKEENKYYRYDFTYDNCTTRLRDILEKIKGQSFATQHILPADKKTFRDLIHDYLEKANQPWSQLGIDILLGSPLDKKISNREAMFLPDYLLKGFDSTSINNKPLVYAKREVLPMETSQTDDSFPSPTIVLGVCFILIFLLSVLFRNKDTVFFRFFDFMFFFLLGALGFLLLFMWFGTNHPMCKDNYNLLWALPLHLPFAFFMFTKKKWITSYFTLLLFYSIALVAAWFILPQELNPALLFIVGIVIVRSYFRVNMERNKKL